MTNHAVSIVFCLLSLLSFSYATVYGWGKNDQGQLGLGHTTSIFTPTSIPYYSTFVVQDMLTAQNYHIGLAANGSAHASGFQYSGQFALGFTNTTAYKTPVPCPSLNSSMDITLPGTACNANMNTNLLGWGNVAGYVQNKTTGSFPKVQTALAAYKFDGKVLSVHSVQEGVIVRLANSTVWVAGTGTNGRLGNGGNTTIYAFAEVPFWRSVSIKKIFSSQSAHACALAVNNSLYCWGNNNLGQLGVGDTIARWTPVKVKFFDDNNLMVQKVVYGDSHTVVHTCGGRLFAFGNNQYGQLGQVVPDLYAHPNPVEVTHLYWNNSIADVVSGASQVMARNTSNSWFVWGGGLVGALGLGNSRDATYPTENPTLYSLNINRIKGSSQSLNFYGWNDPTFVVPTERLACTLENECRAGTHNCSSHAYCTDLERGYMCTCNPGYVGDGYTYGTACTDMNTCATTSNKCVPSATCDDSQLPATCMCPPGFQGDGRTDGTGCTDIDECMGNPCANNANCTNMAPGYTCSCLDGYSGDPNFDGCVIVCPAGQYSTNTTACGDCPPGTYTDGPGALNCRPCPAGFYNAGSAGNSTDSCVKCPIGGYSSLGATYCPLCIHGYTNDPSMIHVDNSTCTTCPLGSYGYYGQCYQCERGKYSFSVAAKQCQYCPPGSVAPDLGSLSCSTCPAGTSSRGGTANCTVCAAGYYSPAGSKDCLRCPAGTSTNGDKGQGSCTNCTAGNYTNKAAAPSCSVCPAGSYSTSSAATSCKRCPRGYYSVGQASTCTQCPTGTYAPSTGSTVCRPCESGSVSSDGINCIPCMAGTYVDNTTNTCKPCAPGTFVAVVGASSCYACNPGSYTPVSGSTYCKRCDANTYSNNTTGYTSCTACPAGTSSSGGASACS